MNVKYAKTKKEHLTLLDIPSGTVFSFNNSAEIYIKLDKNGTNPIFTDEYDNLFVETVNIEIPDDDWEKFDKLIAIAHLSDGRISFMHQDTIVNILACSIVIEENN